MRVGFMGAEIKEEFHNFHLSPMVKAITLLACSYAWTTFKRKLWITSVYRPTDNGVHGQWRGVDADNDNMTPIEKRDIESYINSCFQYDPDRPELKVCLLHTTVRSNVLNERGNKAGDHFHFQVHPNTKHNTKIIDIKEDRNETGV